MSRTDCRKALAEQGYSFLTTCPGPSSQSQLEFWFGTKGTVILLTLFSGDDCSPYCSWTLGLSLDQFKEAL